MFAFFFNLLLLKCRIVFNDHSLLFLANVSCEIANGAKTKASGRTTVVDTSNVLLVFIVVNYITTIQCISVILELYINKFQLE